MLSTGNHYSMRQRSFGRGGTDFVVDKNPKSFPSGHGRCDGFLLSGCALMVGTGEVLAGLVPTAQAGYLGIYSNISATSLQCRRHVLKTSLGHLVMSHFHFKLTLIDVMNVSIAREKPRTTRVPLSQQKPSLFLRPLLLLLLLRLVIQVPYRLLAS